MLDIARFYIIPFHLFHNAVFDAKYQNIVDISTLLILNIINNATYFFLNFNIAQNHLSNLANADSHNFFISKFSSLTKVKWNDKKIALPVLR